MAFLDPADEFKIYSQLFGIAKKLAPDGERSDDQKPPGCRLMHDSANLKLHEALAESERRKDPTPPSAQRPRHYVSLVGLQQRIYVSGRDLNPLRRHGDRFCVNKLFVCHAFLLQLTG
jgi:hypothetical protein